jgi:phage repressor protein C with HTH and peptisase S24 domain
MKSWERLEQVINWSGLTINAFALSIGLKRAENLYQIKKGRNSISKDLAESITKKYCNISKSWLITGEGSMFTDENSQKSESFVSPREIPFYGSFLSGTGGTTEMKFPKPLYYMVLPAFPDCDFAISWMGDSMTPDIPPGSIVILKEMDLQTFFPGEMYLVVTDRYSTIRCVRTIDQDDRHIRLVPINRNAYDEAIIEKSVIRHLFLVKGVISVKTF